MGQWDQVARALWSIISLLFGIAVGTIVGVVSGEILVGLISGVFATVVLRLGCFLYFGS